MKHHKSLPKSPDNHSSLSEPKKSVHKKVSAKDISGAVKYNFENIKSKFYKHDKATYKKKI